MYNTVTFYKIFGISIITATVSGDLSISTFDHLKYNFSGKGEFVLLHANTTEQKLDIQGRFEQVHDNQYGEVTATQLTSVAGK
jgi:von Willebrand factor type D domain.